MTAGEAQTRPAAVEDGRERAGEHGPCVGVVLVHGIGYARPGEVLEATTEALAARDEAPIRFEKHTEVSRHRETRFEERPGTPSSYPCHVKRGYLPGNREVVFGEVYWSDVKSIDARKVTPLFLFLGSILQSHRVIHALLANRRDALAALLRPLLLCGAYLLRGPIVGLNLVLIVMLLAIKYCTIASQTFGWRMEGFYFVLGGLAFTAVLALLLVSRRFLRSGIFAEIGWAMLVLSVLGAGLTVGALEGGPIRGFNEFAFFSKGWLLLVGLWSILSGLVLTAAALLALSLLAAWRRGGIAANRSAVLALAILLFQSIIWATVMRLIWLTLGPDLSRVIGLGALPILSGPETLQTLQLTVLVNILVLAAIFMVTALVGVLRFGLARFLPRSRATRLPRLMFSPLTLNLAIALGVVGYAVSAAQVFSRTAIGDVLEAFAPAMVSAAVDMALPAIQQRPLEFAASSLVLLSPALLFLFGRTLTSSSFLLQDIIDYHPDVAVQGPRRGGGRLAPRDRIADRFAQVIAHLEDQERVNSLVIVAHSQGTVITHDFLKAAMDNEQTGVSMRAPVTVITMGSPLNHIYAHYFNDYAGFADGLDRIGPGVRSWINFFRVDDAIGTRLTSNSSAFVEERALGPGGHANYWSERAVGDAILNGVGAPAATKPTA